MVKLDITIQLETPLLLGAQKQGTVSETMTFLPGAMLRGGIGRMLAQQCSHDLRSHNNCDFAAIFNEKSQPRFGPCYPAISNFSAPFPATARQCKHYPGFKNQYDEAHGIHDALIPLFAFEEASQYGSMDIYEPDCKDSNCNSKLESVSGFYEPIGHSYWQPHPHVMRLSRTAVNRRRRVAADELLYTLEMLSEQMGGLPGRSGQTHSVPTRLRGNIWAANEAQAALLETLLPQVKQLGGAVSRGLGMVKVSVERSIDSLIHEPGDAASQLCDAAKRLDFDIQFPIGSLTYRIARFNKAIIEKLQESGIPNCLRPGMLYFCIDCISDVIWPNGGLPTVTLPEWFAGARRVRRFIQPRRLSGFSGTTGMMRTPQLAVGRGSVFLYCLDSPTPEAISYALATLQAAENEGLGRDKERGQGLIKICSPFHLEVKPK